MHDVSKLTSKASANSINDLWHLLPCHLTFSNPPHGLMIILSHSMRMIQSLLFYWFPFCVEKASPAGLDYLCVDDVPLLQPPPASAQKRTTWMMISY